MCRVGKKPAGCCSFHFTFTLNPRILTDYYTDICSLFIHSHFRCVFRAITCCDLPAGPGPDVETQLQLILTAITVIWYGLYSVKGADSKDLILYLSASHSHFYFSLASLYLFFLLCLFYFPCFFPSLRSITYVFGGFFLSTFQIGGPLLLSLSCPFFSRL